MQKLITLNGSHNEDHRINVLEKSDLVAGLVFWKAIADENPGITWRDIAEGRLNGEFLSGKSWLRSLGRKISGAPKSIASGFKGVIDYVGEKTGSAIRLLTDEQVSDTIIRGVTALGSGGTSEALRSISSSFGGSSDNPVTQGGKEFKKGVQKASFPGGDMFGNIDGRWVMGGIAGLLVLVLVTNVGKK